MIRFGLMGSVALTLSCGGASSPIPPLIGEPVTANDRIAWDQQAADAGELAALNYAFYVDDVRSVAVGVSCGDGAVAGVFLCTSSLPEMTVGGHTVQVAAFITDGGVVRESARSASLRVFKQ